MSAAAITKMDLFAVHGSHIETKVLGNYFIFKRRVIIIIGIPTVTILIYIAIASSTIQQVIVGIVQKDIEPVIALINRDGSMFNI